jgi:hypothetical protein
VILRDESEPLPGGDGVRYRLITETEDHAEAHRVAVDLRRRIWTGEIRRFLNSQDRTLGLAAGRRMHP